MRLSTDQLIKNIRLLEQNVSNLNTHLQRRLHSQMTINTIRQALHKLPKEEKSFAKERQDWNMKKLYAEVFRLSYKRNELQTPAQKVRTDTKSILY